VLLVEDNPDVAKVTTAMLRSLGCSVVAAADGVDALRRLDQGKRFDMVLSDIVMPGPVDGLNLAGRLRAQYPNLPVVLATGYSQTTEAPRGVAILRKPFNLDLLSVALDGALSPSASVKATNAQ
jgi:CheY-like chemotaxis protein